MAGGDKALEVSITPQGILPPVDTCREEPQLHQCNGVEDLAFRSTYTLIFVAGIPLNVCFLLQWLDSLSAQST